MLNLYIRMLHVELIDKLLQNGSRCNLIGRGKRAPKVDLGGFRTID